jgi:epoxyqueuosine reductase
MASPRAVIEQKAKELGFQKFGVARAEELTEEGANLRTWLERGYAATMNWIGKNEEKRRDPRRVLEGAKSVISVAINYYTTPKHSSDHAKGKVSRYAWGGDYHEIVSGKLEQLLGFIRTSHPGIKALVYVDTGPVLEKAWAQRAGIGWLGKHTNIISQDMGSWLFLGEIITDLELTPDAPATDHCGSCTLCIEACPTQAIVEPYIVDSNRCISYLTIEHRGEIDPELTGKFENWVYGCDICQDVCPWNEKFSQQSAEQEFSPRAQNLEPDLVQWSKMTQEEFTRNFKGSPMKRTKLAGIQRNAKVLLEQTT